MHYTTSCNTQSSALEDGRDHRPKHVELIVIINKSLLLHLVGCLYYLKNRGFKLRKMSLRNVSVSSRCAILTMNDVRREDSKVLSLNHTSLSNVGIFCARSSTIQLFCLSGEALKHNVEPESLNHIFTNWPTATLCDISIAWFLGATPYFVLAFGQYETLRAKLLFHKVQGYS